MSGDRIEAGKPFVTRYVIDALPDGCPDSGAWRVVVEYRGRGLWGVVFGSQCLGTDGEWAWEPSPSSREDGWLAEHRFPLDEALRLAQEVFPTIVVNGRMPHAILQWHTDRGHIAPDGSYQEVSQ